MDEHEDNSRLLVILKPILSGTIPAIGGNKFLDAIPGIGSFLIKLKSPAKAAAVKRAEHAVDELAQGRWLEANLDGMVSSVEMTLYSAAAALRAVLVAGGHEVPPDTMPQSHTPTIKPAITEDDLKGRT